MVGDTHRKPRTCDRPCRAHPQPRHTGTFDRWLTQLKTHGADARVVVGEYFPGLEVKALDGPTASAPMPQVRLQLPLEDRPGQADLQRLATTWLAETAEALSGGRPMPADTPGQVTLRFHPTVESYQRQTGAPWFTTATTVRETIDLIPLGTLRQRGLLESTLRHEFVHALTFEALRGAPRWVSEGLAEITRAGRAGLTDGAARAGCPADTAFRRASSGEALRALYGRAAACVDRELRAGRSWPDLATLR